VKKRRPAASALALAFVAAGIATWGAAGCGPKPLPPPPAPPPVPLHLEPACDLVPSAGVEWVVDAKPRAVAEIPDLIPAIALVVPEARFATFAATHGGIDVRQITELCVAKYKEATLTVARAPFDPARVEKAFADRVTHPGGRTLDVANPPVVRVWGEVNGEAQQLVLFGRETVVLEQGRPGPARAAEAFALGKLRRASPALRAGSLSNAVQLAGDAPVRVFAPGPFEGDIAQGLGGLMRASTALAVTARFDGPPARVALHVVLTGAWGKDAAAASERLAAAAHVVAESPFGRLLGLDHPVVAPRVRGTDDALFLDVTVDGLALARGLHDALDAEIGDIMRGAAQPRASDAGNP
jgi:hypothetical protein